jgi:hypothetical protein
MQRTLGFAQLTRQDPSEICVERKKIASKKAGAFKQTPPLGRAGFLNLFAVLVHILGHLQMVLQRRKGLAGPFLQFGVVAALGISLKQRDGILMRADLHWIILRREIFRLGIP